ncbi:hypothetical protein LINGRAHAP2_LOCUS25324 [Linum grandiflorum]
MIMGPMPTMKVSSLNPRSNRQSIPRIETRLGHTTYMVTVQMKNMNQGLRCNHGMTLTVTTRCCNSRSG